MLLFQKLSILPKGYIQNGTVQYSADPQTGEISYQYDFCVRIIFMTKSFAGSGVTKADPAQLLSSNLKEGEELKIGPVSAKVTSIQDQKATCQLVIEDGDNGIHEAGTLVFDLSGQYLKIVSINEVGTVKGFEVDLEAIPA